MVLIKYNNHNRIIKNIKEENKNIKNINFNEIDFIEKFISKRN